MSAEARHVATVAVTLLVASGLPAGEDPGGVRFAPAVIRLAGDGFVLGSDYPVRIDRDAATGAAGQASIVPPCFDVHRVSR